MLLFHGADGDAEPVGDLAMGEQLHLAQQEDGAAAAVGPVDLSEHFQAWERLMAQWWPTQTDSIKLGYSWSSLSQADYCLVGHG